MARALLEQPERVPVSVIEVLQAGFLQSCGQGDHDGRALRFEAVVERDLADDGRVAGLLGVEVHPGAMDAAADSAGDRSVPGTCLRAAVAAGAEQSPAQDADHSGRNGRDQQ